MSESPETWLSGTPEPPFRWDVRKREQLGTLADMHYRPIADWYLAELLVCTARVLGFCDDGDLFFVGRSPDSLFDLLSGILAETSWEDRLRLMPFSLGTQQRPFARSEVRDALRRYLTSLELAPQQISSRARPTVLVDVVYSGGTLGGLVGAWHQWSEELGVPWVQVRRKLRVVGITERTKTSPKAWRWQQHASWASLLSTRSIKNVPVSFGFWHILASGHKASRSFPPSSWGDPSLSQPLRDDQAMTGLRQAAYIYDLGRTPSVRGRFTAELLRTPTVRFAWMRTLAHDLRARSDDESATGRVQAVAAREAEGVKLLQRAKEIRLRWTAEAAARASNTATSPATNETTDA